MRLVLMRISDNALSCKGRGDIVARDWIAARMTE